MSEFVTNGDRMKVVLTADVLAGTALLVGNKVVITCVDGKNGDEVNCYVSGVHKFAANGAIAQGAFVNFNNSTKEFKTASLGTGGEVAVMPDPIHGVAWADAADGFVQVKIG